MALIFDGTNGITFPAGGQGNPAGNVVGTTDAQTVTNKNISADTLSVNANNISADNSLGFRNRIINGDMRIAQRGTAAVTAASSFPVDRFLTGLTSNDGTFSAQQSTAVVPTGFTHSVGITVTAADASIASTENFLYQSWIEGNNIADLGFGTASAKTVTISFWVRGSVTGTYAVVIANSSDGASAPNRSYVSTYTINSADTWEYKTVTVPGDTGGTWQTGNLRGMLVRFGLTAGTNFQQAADSWGAVNAVGTSSTVQLLSTLNATWYITGVQLEAGSVATPFERRPYGMELSLCQRYFYNLVAAAASGASTTKIEFYYQHPVPMRAAPTLNVVGLIRIEDPTVSAYNQSSGNSTLEQASYLSMKPGFGNFTGLTATRPYYLAAAASSITASPPTNLCQVSAEL